MRYLKLTSIALVAGLGGAYLAGHAIGLSQSMARGIGVAAAIILAMALTKSAVKTSASDRGTDRDVF